MSEIKIHCKYDKLVDPQALMNHPKNRNKHGQDQIDRLAELYKYHGIRHPIIVSNRSKCIVAGHGRKLAAIRAGLKEVPVVYQDFKNDESEYAFIQADNAIALWAELDMSGINSDIGDLGPDFDINMLGIQDFTLDVAEKDEIDSSKGSLSEKFGVPPFTVLDARQGYWLDRKREWLAFGIDSKAGREDVKAFNTKGSLQKDGKLDDQENVSIFDPVLCELAYSWFTPKNAHVLDPFAGGSVRGLCAGLLGRNYVGIDLSAKQIDANIQQANICKTHPPKWINGDSKNVASLTENKNFDFIFSCPPYSDLEVYSDDPRDISNMNYDDFISAYRTIISESCKLLKDDRFCCFVIGEVRDKKGLYRNFLGDTITAFLDAGLKYYNEACYITPNGTLALRSAKQMNSSRKLGKGHQNFLVFVKGDPKKATDFCGEIEIDLSTLEAGNE